MRALAFCVVAAIAVTATLATTAPLTVFAAAVVRRDGVIVPIGTFTGRGWELSWPAEPADKLDIPITLDAVPIDWWGRLGRRIDWQLWADGAPGRTLKVIGPKLVDTMCTARLALSTDYRHDDVPPPRVQPYPKAGIAVSPPAGSGTATGVAIGRVEVFAARSPEWQGIAAHLTRVFDDEEDRLAAEWARVGDPHPIERKERVKTPLTIEAMYGTDDGPDRIFYVEASRKYDHADDERAICAVAFGSVYFRWAGNTIAPLDGAVRVVPCDRRGLVYMLPLGATRLEKTLYWFTQYSGWDFEQYTIVEFKKTRVEVAASTFGGRCENRPARPL